MSNVEIEAKVNEYLEIQGFIEELTSDLEEVKDELKNILREKNVDELAVGSRVVRYKQVATLKFDTKSFKSNFSDLYKLYCRDSLSCRFSVS